MRSRAGRPTAARPQPSASSVPPARKAVLSGTASAGTDAAMPRRTERAFSHRGRKNSGATQLWADKKMHSREPEPERARPDNTRAMKDRPSPKAGILQAGNPAQGWRASLPGSRRRAGGCTGREQAPRRSRPPPAPYKRRAAPMSDIPPLSAPSDGPKPPPAGWRHGLRRPGWDWTH